MPAPSPILRKCLDQAVAAAPQLIERCVDQAVAALQDAEVKSAKVAQRREIAEAWQALAKHRAGWIDRYPRDLRAALDDEPVTASSFASLDGIKGGLSLVDDAQLADTIESSRLQQLLLPVVEQALAELDGLMSTALGLPSVQPERNPLRPDIFAQVLRNLLGEAAGDAAWPALWTRHMAQPMGRELERLYRDLAKLLKAADVRTATYRVLQAPVSPAAAQRAANAAAAAAAAEGMGFGNGMGPGDVMHPADGGWQYNAGPGTGWAADDPRLPGASGFADLAPYTLDHALFQDFLFGGGGPAQQQLAPTYYDRVDQELAQLQEEPEFPALPFDAQEARQYEHLPSVDRPQRHVDIDSPLDDAVWGHYSAPRQRALVRSQLKKKAENVGQVLGLEVVRKLVGQVAQDPRLLAPVREAIVGLEPSLLRLAMVDPRFFSDEQHAGRRLVERVAERSFKYNDEFSPEFSGFAGSVIAAFRSLNERDVDDVQPFQSALGRLESSWSAQDQREEAARTEVLDAVRFAEQRQAEADQIAWTLSQRPDLDNVPSVVQDFLFGPWALVMAHARLVDNRKNIDPGGYGSVVSDLIWSVKREVTLRQPARLIEMIPGLLETLRNGLAALGKDARESEPFFQELEKLHRPVLRLRAKHRRDALDSALGELEPDPSQPMPLTERVVPKPSQQLWMGRRELDAAGFEDTLPSDHTELSEDEHALPYGTESRALDDGFADDDFADTRAPEPDASDAPDAPAAANGGHDAPAVDAPPPAAEAASPVAGLAPVAAAAEPIDAEAILAALREDDWVDLYSKRRWLRARLIWASSKGTLFMFVSHGGQPHSMTRRSCERLVRDRLLRPVERAGVVSRAINTLRSEPAATVAVAGK